MTQVQRIESSTVTLGEGMTVRRAVPTKQRRTIGAWCFMDHFGPTRVAGTRGMRVGPHPHIGLQTVTWLLSGEVLHRDSLGSLQRIEPGAVNLMTSGRGISHAEESPEPHSDDVHGVQFWIALPDSARNGAPTFHHHPRVPVVKRDGAEITVLAGELCREVSPARIYSELVGASIALPASARTTVPLRAEFEHGVIVTHGEVEVVVPSAAVTPADAGALRLGPGSLLYFPPGLSELRFVAGSADAGVILVGGVPFPEPILMWWNFVARTKEELTTASRDWNKGADYLGDVKGYDGPRLVAPIPPWAESSRT